MRFPSMGPPTARGGTRPQTAPPPSRRPPTDLDPVPFPGGAEAALEFAAFEKGLLEGSGDGGSAARNGEPPNRAPPDPEPPIGRRSPISEANRDSARWMLAGAGMAAGAAAILLLLLSSGRVTAGFAAVLQAMAQP